MKLIHEGDSFIIKDASFKGQTIIREENKVGEKKPEWNDIYEGALVVARTPELSHSVNIVMGTNQATVLTLYAGMTEALVKSGLLDKKTMKIVLKGAFKNERN